MSAGPRCLSMARLGIRMRDSIRPRGMAAAWHDPSRSGRLHAGALCRDACRLDRLARLLWAHAPDATVPPSAGCVQGVIFGCAANRSHAHSPMRGRGGGARSTSNPPATGGMRRCAGQIKAGIASMQSVGWRDICVAVAGGSRHDVDAPSHHGADVPSRPKSNLISTAPAAPRVGDNRYGAPGRRPLPRQAPRGSGRGRSRGSGDSGRSRLRSTRHIRLAAPRRGPVARFHAAVPPGRHAGAKPERRASDAYDLV